LSPFVTRFFEIAFQFPSGQLCLLV
jgi:hypothetical protein